MGITELVARVATRRVHVFLVETPGRSLLRMTAQAAIARRGWVEATGPADADALLVCGQPDGDLQELIDAVWEQISSPRYRATVDTDESLTGMLDTIPNALQDAAHQHADARNRRLHLDDHRGPDPAPKTEHMPNHTDTSDDHDHTADTSPGDDTSAPDMTMGSGDAMDMDSHGDMGMDMDMSGPAGIALAGGGDDRDGLEMDVTHLTLGPLLAGWPPDLVLHCTLHGDVVADARAEHLRSSGPGEQPPETARLLDDAARLLMLAGWEPAAQELARLRNDLLESENPQLVVSRLRRVTARVRRSRTLRWSLKGTTTLGGTLVRDRLLQWLDTAQGLLEDPAARPADPVPAPTAADIRLAVIGQELAATRLIVAALGSSRTRMIEAVPHE